MESIATCGYYDFEEATNTQTTTTMTTTRPRTTPTPSQQSPATTELIVIQGFKTSFFVICLKHKLLPNGIFRLAVIKIGNVFYSFSNCHLDHQKQQKNHKTTKNHQPNHPFISWSSTEKTMATAARRATKTTRNLRVFLGSTPKRCLNLSLLSFGSFKKAKKNNKQASWLVFFKTL